MRCHPLRWLKVVAVFLFFPVLALAADLPPPQDSAVWQRLHAALFQNRPINEGPNQPLELHAPVRAHDAAVVPVSVKGSLPQTADRYVKTIHLIVDNNPAPLAAVFHLTPDTGLADIETRIRVEAYTYVRAIAEMNDGSLFMSTRHVKASGGCSAPANRASGDKSEVGRMRLVTEEAPTVHKPLMTQLMIRHPNHSGMVMDQLTRHFQPPHYVRGFEVSYAGKTILTAELDFAISENPNVRFYIVPHSNGVLVARAQDSEDYIYETSQQLTIKD